LELRDHALEALADTVSLIERENNLANDIAARTSQYLENRNSAIEKSPEQSFFASSSIKDRG
jgi:hypothetical protein